METPDCRCSTCEMIFPSGRQISRLCQAFPSASTPSCPMAQQPESARQGSDPHQAIPALAIQVFLSSSLGPGDTNTANTGPHEPESWHTALRRQIREVTPAPIAPIILSIHQPMRCCCASPFPVLPRLARRLWYKVKVHPEVFHHRPSLMRLFPSSQHQPLSHVISLCLFFSLSPPLPLPYFLPLGILFEFAQNTSLASCVSGCNCWEKRKI